MTRITWKTTLALLTGLFVVSPSCGGDDEVTAEECSEIWGVGNADAEASNPSCIECNYETYWSIEDYDDDVRMWCYAGGFGSHYDYGCQEVCSDSLGDPKGCCGDALDFVDEQREALGLYGLDPGFGIN